MTQDLSKCEVKVKDCEQAADELSKVCSSTGGVKLKKDLHDLHNLYDDVEEEVQKQKIDLELEKCKTENYDNFYQVSCLEAFQFLCLEIVCELFPETFSRYFNECDFHDE